MTMAEANANATPNRGPRATENPLPVDPTTLSVVWNRFENILDNCGEKILHGAQSFVMGLARDFGQGLLNTEGNVVAACGYMPIHIFVASVAMQAFLKEFGGGFKPGDLYIGNDPHIVRSGHMPDWTFVRPLFYDGELYGFFQGRAHMEDTGGFMPGGYAPGAYDVVAEGLNIPPLRIIEEGALDEKLWRLIRRNLRNPNLVEMDMMLINAALKLGEQDMTQVCDKYGLETVKRCMEQIMSAGEQAMRAEIAKMPDGVYFGESAADWDGHTDKPVWVRTKLTIHGEEMTFDLSESDTQVTFINSPLGNTVYGVRQSVFPMVDPAVPKNDGAAQLIHVVTKQGTCVDPTYPATVGACGVTLGQNITEACQIALAKAIPEAATAGWCRHFSPIEFGMDPEQIDPRTGNIRQFYSETFMDASGGGVKGFDGWPGLAPFFFVGCITRPDMEVFETAAPFRVMRAEFIQDWEGAGEFRSGPGVLTEIVAAPRPPEASAFLQSGNCDGMEFAPRGAAGGQDGRKNEMWIESPNGGKRIFRTFALGPIEAGETLITKGAGGGGWGDPLNRDVERVRDDVQNELISPERARDVYGVVIAVETFEVNMESTETQRKELRARKA
jgi:N-methylhydantoinase B